MNVAGGRVLALLFSLLVAAPAAGDSCTAGPHSISCSGGCGCVHTTSPPADCSCDCNDALTVSATEVEDEDLIATCAALTGERIRWFDDRENPERKLTVSLAGTDFFACVDLVVGRPHTLFFRPDAEPKPGKMRSASTFVVSPAVSSQLDVLSVIQAPTPFVKHDSPPGGAGQVLSIDAKNANIRTVLRSVSALAGVTIIVGDEVRGAVTLNKQGVSFTQVLSAFRSLGYDFLRVDEGIYQVMLVRPLGP